MRPPYSTLTPTHIYTYAASLLEPYLQWHDYGPKCTVKVLLQVLFYAAGHLYSVFAAQIPKGLRKRPQRVAIDLSLVPYHGQPHQRLEEIYRSQAKSGTTHPLPLATRLSSIRSISA